MATGDVVSIVHKKDSFSHTDACRIFDLAVRARGKTVVIDLKHATHATTSAFARLVLLRRTLLQAGRDMLLEGLRDRTATVYEINRLNLVLPTR